MHGNYLSILVPFIFAALCLGQWVIPKITSRKLPVIALAALFLVGWVLYLPTMIVDLGWPRPHEHFIMFNAMPAFLLFGVPLIGGILTPLMTLGLMDKLLSWLPNTRSEPEELPLPDWIVGAGQL